MGRPINHRKIGGDGDADGNQLLFSAWFDGENEAEEAYLVKQVATNKFRLMAKASADRNQICTLVEEIEDEGQCSITVVPYNGPEQIDSVLINDAGTFDGVDGVYSATVVGGTYTRAATLEIEIDNNVVIDVVVTDGGSYTVLPDDGFGVNGLPDSVEDDPTFDLDDTSIIREHVKKFMLYKVVTFENNVYKYSMAVSADADGEADVDSE